MDGHVKTNDIFVYKGIEFHVTHVEEEIKRVEVNPLCDISTILSEDVKKGLQKEVERRSRVGTGWTDEERGMGV